MISSKTHAILDYVVGILLIASPWLLGFADDSAATVIPVLLGVSTLLYSLLTNYEYAMARVIPYKIHLTIDFAAGFLLLASHGCSDSVTGFIFHMLFWELLKLLRYCFPARQRQQFMRQNRFKTPIIFSMQYDRAFPNPEELYFFLINVNPKSLANI